jgi:hypothetical protein
MEGLSMTYVAYRGDSITVNGITFSLRAELAKLSRGRKSRVAHGILLTAAALSLGTDLKKMLEGKLKAVGELRCTVHDKQAWTENGQLQACCDDMVPRVRAALEQK